MRRWLIAALVLVGCADQRVEVLTGIPTFYGDVAPALSRNCWCCHAGLTEPSLLTPSQVAPWIGPIAEDVHADDRRDGPRASDGCEGQRTAAARGNRGSLTERIRSWDEAGRVPGDPADGPEPRACGRTGAPIEVRGSPRSDPASGVEVLCYGQESPAPAGRAVVGLRLRSAPAALRSVYVITNSAPIATAEGNRCPEITFPLDVDLLGALWARQPSLTYPRGLGVPIPEGHYVQLFAIYDSSIGAADGRETIVELDTVPAGEVTHVQWTHLAPVSLALRPGGTPTDEVSASVRDALRVHGVVVQQFEYGTRASATLRAEAGAGAALCRVTHDPFDPTAARAVLFEPPVTDVRSIEGACAWDLTDAEENVYAGNPPDGEVCLVSVLLDAP